MGPTLPPPGVGTPVRHCTDDCSSAARSAWPDWAPPLPLGRWANRSKASSARPPGRSSGGTSTSRRRGAPIPVDQRRPRSCNGDYRAGAAGAGPRGRARPGLDGPQRGPRRALERSRPRDDPLSFSVSYGRLRRIALASATPAPTSTTTGKSPPTSSALVLLYQAGYNERARADRHGADGSRLASSLIRVSTLMQERVPGANLAHYLDAVDRFCPNADVRIASPSERGPAPTRRQGRDPGLARHRRRRPRQARPRPERTLRRRRQRRDSLFRSSTKATASPRRLLHPARPRTEHRQLRLDLLTSLTLALGLLKGSM